MLTDSLQTTAKLVAEHISHLRDQRRTDPAAEGLGARLRAAFDKLVSLLHDMNSTGAHTAAQEAYLRLAELRRCHFDRAAIEQHQNAVTMAAARHQPDVPSLS